MVYISRTCEFLILDELQLELTPACLVKLSIRQDAFDLPILACLNSFLRSFTFTRLRGSRSFSYSVLAVFLLVCRGLIHH